MLPLRDRNPSGVFPTVTMALIVANVLVFLYEVRLGPAIGAFLKHYALVPAIVTGSIHYHEMSVAETVGPFFTSMFLHGGWLHLISNMWFLWIFGDNVEDTLGAARYLLFYLLCGVGAAVTHYAIQPNSTMPVLGASGAIAGVLGAYIVLFPSARVLTLVPVFFFIQFMELPAWLILGYWFLLQVLSSALEPVASQQGGTAFAAHIGGFLLGMILILVMRPRKVAV